MSSSNTSDNLNVSLNNASNFINRYLSIFIYVFGLIGNVLNVLVLLQRTLRTNTSTIFFVGSSVAGLIVILSGLTSRMMSGYAADLTVTIDWICKLRNFILYAGRTVVLLMVVFATIDRWLSSSVHVQFRRMSNMKNVRWSVSVVLVYTCLLNTPILFCYEANLTGILRACYGSTYSCRLLTDLIYAFGTTLLPLLLMIIFGLLIINNVRGTRRRVQVVAGSVPSYENRNTIVLANGQQRTGRRDHTLLRILLMQVTLLVLFTCPHATQKVYSSFASNSSSQSAVQTLIFNIFSLLTFIASGMPFYIYTLTGGSIFRNALFSLVKTFVRKILFY